MSRLKSNWAHKVLNAEISVSYETTREADAVFEAVAPDNVKVPKGLLIKTVKQGTKVFTKVECRTKLLTFIATIDDLMSAISVAERSISAVKKH